MRVQLDKAGYGKRYEAAESNLVELVSQFWQVKIESNASQDLSKPTTSFIQNAIEFITCFYIFC